MAQIYTQQRMELYKLLDKAASTGGASLVIPDLQRPFVWTPNQVTLLIDSLVRGWPFGTLLLWRVLHDEERHMPSRAFWQVVDRTGDDEGTVLQKLAMPAEYMMVLDGQQRLQSLLIVTHGDNWGFKLSDKDWAIETGAKSSKGPSNRKHWSIGSLCLDLEAFLSHYEHSKQQLTEVEFDKVLRWAVLDESTGRSTAVRPDTYVDAICVRTKAPFNKQLIRFSRLWTLAGHNPAAKEKNYYEELRKLLTEHGLEVTKAEKYVPPLAELMTTLRDVKLADVTFLELSPFDGTVTSREAYDDAIVSIFTRLNTAGRTLTREEITFAWLKIGWDSSKTAAQNATKCFEELLEEIRSDGKQVGIDIGIDEVVGSISFIWAVAFRQGTLLSNRDLLQGEIIRPMAKDLSSSWSLIEKALTGVAEIISERKLEYRRHYSSVNALTVIWTLHFLSLQQAERLSLTTTQKDDLEKQLDTLLNQYLDRWLICSSWAERWTGGSGPVLRGYATDLAADLVNFMAAKDVQALTKIYSSRLKALVQELETDAIAFIDTRLNADAREQVRIYHTALWIWHRLTTPRWDASKKPLQIGKAKNSSLDVDHIISVKLWESKTIDPADLKDGESKELFVNSIGNCLLLQKSFNIAKKAKSLRSFMEEVHEVKSGKMKIDDWATALSLTKFQLDGDKAIALEALTATKNRETLVKNELKDFVRGTAKRVDV